jgi:NADPH2:quinone reductase
MKVIGFRKPLPISDPECFLDLNAEKPLPAARDLLVEIRAVGINPVDAKIRGGGGPGSPTGDLKILGWDAAGVVRAIGAEVTLFCSRRRSFLCWFGRSSRLLRGVSMRR